MRVAHHKQAWQQDSVLLAILVVCFGIVLCAAQELLSVSFGVSVETFRAWRCWEPSCAPVHVLGLLQLGTFILLVDV